ncbi:hypothetical protein H310_03028 [Aphanomyces invadans]|uniref:Dynein heavy chain linker domain-containing protein n=1 Tax=Aphanomyces invadans TaxID=157072 RepID=A0A024UMV3_9STRA|nr:hypothetical protein H310_03028 [Aphanomyces invadans]ETW06913.1 hypothetical protein H310_03028 [Aphanomyces invadans]|eukprot:XP_008864988.1 hypothetical protein H310_03028 [Aphanomyces invadans]
MDDEASTSKSVRMNARKEVDQHEAAVAVEFANSSRWIDAAEYERLASIMAREKEDEFRKSQPALQLHKPKTKSWHPPARVPLHKRKQPDLAIPEALKSVAAPAPPPKHNFPSPLTQGHRTIKLRESIQMREKQSSMVSLRLANKDLYATLVERFRHNTTMEPASPVKSIMDVNNVHTIEDAILYFLCEKHRRNILYFQLEKQKPNDSVFRPYDLVHIPPLTQNNKEEHYVMGPTNMVHYKANENVECIPVAEWVYHSHMFDHLLKGIPLFQQLLRRRMFASWCLNVKLRLYRETRMQLCRTLHFARPHFQQALRTIHDVSTTIRRICALDVTSDATSKAITLNEWNHLHETKVGVIESQLNDAKAMVHVALYTLVESIRDDGSPDLLLEQLDNADMYKMRQAYPPWKSIPIVALKQFKQDNKTLVTQAKRDLVLLPSLFRLLQYVFTESLYFMVLASINRLHMQFSAAQGCSITVAVSFLLQDANGMVLEPSEADMLHHSMEALSRLIALSNSYSSEYRLVEYLTPREISDAVPDGHIVPGMRLVDLLKLDSNFHTKVQNIRMAIKVAFTKVATQVKSFEMLRPIYGALQDPSEELPTMGNLSNYMVNLPNLLKSIHTKIGRLDAWQHQCHKTQASWNIGFLEIHCRHIISELLERINNQRIVAHQLLTDLTTQGILQCVTSLKDAITVMDERPQTTEAFCEQRRCIRTLSDNEKQLLQEIRMVEEAYKALRTNCPAAASDCIGQFNLIHALQAKYNLSFQANIKFSKKMLPVIGQQVAQALQKFTAQCKRILNALEANATVRNTQVFATGKADFESRLNPLNEIKSELDSIADAAVTYYDYQKIMGIKVTPIILLESARVLWLEVHDVWTLCQQWRLTHAMMHAHKFIVQSWLKNQAATKDFLVRSESLKCRFENKIFFAIQAELHAFLKQLDLAVELGAPYIKPLHWEQIFKVRGLYIDQRTD